MSLRERRLIRKLRERDEKAFREVVDNYRDRIYNLTYRMLGSQEEAEDLSQEIFITLFKSIDSFRGDAKLSTWLYRIAVNHCKNRIKYLARRQDRAQSSYDDEVMGSRSPAATTTPAHIPPPDKQLEAVELERLMQACIAELDEEHRMVLVLRDVEELPYDEIATITNLPSGTVKSRIHRARVALRKKLLRRM